MQQRRRTIFKKSRDILGWEMNSKCVGRPIYSLNPYTLGPLMKRYSRVNLPPSNNFEHGSIVQMSFGESGDFLGKVLGIDQFNVLLQFADGTLIQEEKTKVLLMPRGTKMKPLQCLSKKLNDDNQTMDIEWLNLETHQSYLHCISKIEYQRLLELYYSQKWSIDEPLIKFI